VVDSDFSPNDEMQDEPLDAVAIVGMALRVPGAQNLDQFWCNLRDGVESTTFFDDAQLRAAGVDAATLQDPLFVKAFGLLQGAELFDAGFFDITPREAEVLDPQHRQLLECAWEALEHAGQAPGSAAFKDAGRVGLYSGVGLNSYLLQNLIGQRELLETLGAWQISLGNDKDFATTRVAYKLDLRGPAVNVSTACSTSLVAVAMGCQSLLSYQCDLILAGGCSVHLPQDQGYWHHPGGTLSPDGRCRAFDADAQGTLDGNGVAMVVLKRLDDALRDGDTVYAVIRGYAINNDGALKVGYTAPSVEGQAAVIREAQEMANVDANTIAYVETHGTGTDLGDLVEVTALSEAFRSAGVTALQQCAIGSVKTNVGHLDTAAGTASLIKTALGLGHAQMPPSLHFKRPNPKLGLESSPFYVNARLTAWPSLRGAPRRAGVSSFGIGGTNAHVVLEEAPLIPAGASGRPWQVLPLSARSGAALEQGAQRLETYLEKNLAATPELALADVAYTLQVGRKAFDVRQAWVMGAQSIGFQPQSVVKIQQTTAVKQNANVVFAFPGQDAQFAGMAQSLYRDEPLFRAEVDHCANILREQHGIDLMARMASPGGSADPAFATDSLPLFVVEYGLAQVWLKLGVKPRAMLGYSLGEYVCACLAGVMTLEEVLTLSVAGSRLLSLIKPGALLAVSLGEEELRPLLATSPNAEVEIAMIMAPRQCIVGGSATAVAALQDQLKAQGVFCMLSQLDLPFHTAQMQPFLAPYLEAVRKVRLQKPRIPYVSCVSGDWITDAEATNPDHYLDLAGCAVRLTQGLERVFALPDALLLEVGPSQTLANLALLHGGRPATLTVLATLADARLVGAEKADAAFATALARVWTAGINLDWTALYADERRRRVALPTYAFEHRRFWVAPAQVSTAAAAVAAVPLASGKLPDAAQWFNRPVWQELTPLATSIENTLENTPAAGEWLLVGGGRVGAAEPLAARLRAAGGRVELVEFIAGVNTGAWDSVLAAQIASGHRPDHIVYLDLLASPLSEDADLLEQGFYNLIALGQTVGRSWFAESLKISVVANHLLAFGEMPPAPALAAVLGPLRVLPQEYPNLRCQAVDLAWPEQAWLRERQLDLLAAELIAGTENTVALHQGRRWCERYVAYPLPTATLPNMALRPAGVYLITGGIGNIGLALAKRIAQRAPGARLLLTSRSGLPQTSGDSKDAGGYAGAYISPAQQSRLHAVAELQALGAEVRIAAVDVTDAAAMAAVFSEAERDWGPLNGVIHAAGIVGMDSFATVAESSIDFCSKQLTPKLQGARVLERVLQERPLDFCLMCSSLSPILGGLGFTAYAAANASLDAFVAAHNMTHPTRWLCVNWEGWRFDDNLGGPRSDEANSAGAAMAELGLTASEGADAFERILAVSGLERIVLSTADLAQRIKQWVTMDTPPSVAVEAVARHARPAMLGAYVAPSGEVALAVCRLWEQLLGIDGISADDSFFELGGNSLLLTQLLAQIRKHFQLELSLASLFESPTIGAIAALIEAVRAEAETGGEDWEQGEI